MFGVETVLWSTEAENMGKSYRGVLGAAERFMKRWHEDEAQLSRQRHTSTVDGAQGNAGRGGNRRRRRSIRETAVDESKKQMADRVARYRADQLSGTCL